MKPVGTVLFAPDSWYVVHCKSAKEQYTADALQHLLGLTTYVPEIALSLQKEIRRVPFFSGYLFLQADLQKMGTHSINACPGVLKLLDFGNGPVEIPPDLMEIIRKEIDRYGKYLSYQKLSPGDPVRVTSGPLEGLQAIFLEAKAPGNRANILLHVLGRLSKVQLDVNALEKFDVKEDFRPVVARRERYTRGKGRKIHRPDKIDE